MNSCGTRITQTSMAWDGIKRYEFIEGKNKNIQVATQKRIGLVQLAIHKGKLDIQHISRLNLREDVL